MKENSGKTKFILLGMLARQPQTGYTIKKWLENEYSHFWLESFGQIYPALKELVKEGLAVCSSAPEKANGRRQIEYQITDQGRNALSEWLKEKPEVEKIRYEILLKISFGENTEPDILIGHLDEFLHRQEELIVEMNYFIKLFDEFKESGTDCTYSKLTALCGLHLYSAMKDWAVEAKTIISERNSHNEKTKNP